MIACFVNAVGALCDLISLRVEPGEAPFVWKHFFGIVGGFCGVVSRRVFRATAGLIFAGSDFRNLTRRSRIFLVIARGHFAGGIHLTKA